MKVLLLGSGGPAGIGVTRCLKRAGHEVVGADSTDWGIRLSETDETHLLPHAGSKMFSTHFDRLLRTVKPDFVHAQPDPLVLELSKRRHLVSGLGARYFLPRHEVVVRCQDKWECYERWRDSGLTVPETMLVKDAHDLFQFIAAGRLIGGRKVWLRPRRGAGGKDALATEHLQEAIRHIAGRWGEFTVADQLRPETVTCQMLFYEGQLVVSQQRTREAWTGGDRGSALVSRTSSDPDADETALAAVYAVDSAPHGLYGVDMVRDWKWRPNPTEINVGRFFTTIEFFEQAGLNLPKHYVYVSGGNFSGMKRNNPLPDNLLWIRSFDREPVLVR